MEDILLSCHVRKCRSFQLIFFGAEIALLLPNFVSLRWKVVVPRIFQPKKFMSFQFGRV